VKLSHDPNNTKWTRDNGGFGHKIMTAQGWKPGDILGAKNASHAELHTAANASHIRVFVKDDNLGLGAKRGSGLAEGECTGLDVFQSLLGRLNGKGEDELIKEQKSREDLKRAIYTERRWGSIRFVRGGFLIGDKIQQLIDNEEDRIRQLAQSSLGVVAGAIESDSSQSTTPPTSERLIAEDKKDKKDKTDKKGKKKQQKVEKEHEESAETDLKKKSNSDQATTSAQDAPQEILSTKPKKLKKKRKEFEEAAEESNAPTPDEQDISQKSKKKKRKKPSADPKNLEEGSTKPAHTSISQSPTPTTGSSTPQSILGGRHAVRSRNIAQKRLAVLDTASLNQVRGQVLFFNEFEILIVY
jgi:Pin2-interacting protein X1